MRRFLALMSLAALTGCVAGPPVHQAPSNDYERLARQCHERGGMLKPIPGAHSTEDAANYACEFRGTEPKP